MKRCGRCGETKPIADFHRSSRSGVQAWCRPCRRDYDAAYHAATRERRLQQAKIRRTAFVVWYRGLKEGKPCADCGGRFHHAAMQWDHRPGTVKYKDVATLRNTTSRRAVLAEIEKCDLVCANCHSVRTFLRSGA